MEEYLSKSTKDGTWADTIDIFSCATVLQCTIAIFSVASRKWFNFEPRVNCAATISHNCSFAYPFTLVLHDLYPGANHFHLLEPEGNCCNGPAPTNAASKVHIMVDLTPNINNDLKNNLPLKPLKQI